MNTCPERRQGAFTLVEVITVITIVSALALITLPISQRIMGNAKAASCMSNLRGLGSALQMYLADHDNNLPTLVMARDDKTEDGLTLDNTLADYAGGPNAFHCPGDNKNLWQTSGSSYLWNSLVNGQNVASMDFMGMVNEGARIPLISDKENFHQYQKVQVNILYADGHAAKEIQFVPNGDTK